MTALKQGNIIQKYIDIGGGETVGIHKVTPLSAADTFTIPQPANSTNGASIAMLRRTGQGAVTVSYGASTDFIATITSATVGVEIVIVTLHRTALHNYRPEA